MGKWWAKKHLSLAQQYLFLKNSLIAPGKGKLTNVKIVWRYQSQPTPLNRVYTIRIEYSLGSPPNVFVEDPDVKLLANGRDLPHVYHAPLRLCLYMPRSQQWLASKRIDKTIIPWVTIWLYYFEEWLVSDEWKGDGKHPNETNTGRMNRRLRRLQS